MAPPVVRLVKVRIFGEHFVDRCVQVKRNDPPVSEAPHNTAAAAALPCPCPAAFRDSGAAMEKELHHHNITITRATTQAPAALSLVACSACAYARTGQLRECARW